MTDLEERMTDKQRQQDGEVSENPQSWGLVGGSVRMPGDVLLLKAKRIVKTLIERGQKQL